MPLTLDQLHRMVSLNNSLSSGLCYKEQESLLKIIYVEMLHDY